MKILPYLLIASILFSGCQPSRRVVIKQMPADPPGTVFATEEAERVRQPAVIKAYSVGPYIDPNSPMVVHREHEILVEEAASSWNLMPSSYIQRGPTASAPDAAYAPQMSTTELQLRLREIESLMQSTRGQSSNIDQAVGQLQVVTNILTQVLKRQLSLEQRTRALEDQSFKPANDPTTNAPSQKRRSVPDPW